ncbi:MAG: EAL domain-containing protein [Sphaerochaetaceae bacterium]|nr:EAL domain-containing protein [Sphaerochaetaceae bacterium]
MKNPQREQLDIDKLFEQEMAKAETDSFALVFRLVLKENLLIPLRMHDYFEILYGERLKGRIDYRQLMLSFVLEHVVKGNQEYLIQHLLPERLASYLIYQNDFSGYFHMYREGKVYCCRFVIRKIGPTPENIFIGIELNAKEPRTADQMDCGIRVVVFEKDDVLKKLLSPGYEVYGADSIQNVLDVLAARKGRITSVLTGGGLSESEVLDLLHAIGEGEDAQKVPVLVTMLEQWERTEADFLAAGAFDFQYLPHNVQVIGNRLSKVHELKNKSALISKMEKDGVTGLYSREFFTRYATEKMKDDLETEYCFLCVDIENYQMYVEKFGEVVGNLVINHVSNCIRRIFPDSLIGGRISDDEIAFLLEKMPLENPDVLSEIRKNAPIPNLSVKIGMVPANASIPVKNLYANASTAISSIRMKYGETIAEYSDAMRMDKQKELRILGSMEAALEQNQFSIYYQPKHCTETGRVCGSEALVRWTHPEYGFMSPGEFIPVFERVGFIRGLDRYVLTKVCADLARWKAMGLPLIPVSVNLSRRDFEDEDLASWIIDRIKDFGLEPGLVHIEVTESAFTDSPEMVISGIRKLHENGFSVELDDFGCGYSSLTVLNNMDIDVLKIDRSIILQDSENQKRSVLDFCIRLAKVMGLKTVAEGVETEAQRRRLKKLQCDMIQGFYYSRPLPVSGFEKYLVATKPKD